MVFLCSKRYSTGAVHSWEWKPLIQVLELWEWIFPPSCSRTLGMFFVIPFSFPNFSNENIHSRSQNLLKKSEISRIWSGLVPVSRTLGTFFSLPILYPNWCDENIHSRSYICWKNPRSAGSGQGLFTTQVWYAQVRVEVLFCLDRVPPDFGSGTWLCIVQLIAETSRFRDVRNCTSFADTCI